MAPKQPNETPVEAFERLRQCFDILKENHTDPWSWHEYLAEEEEEIDLTAELGDVPLDPELEALKPKRISNIDKLKAHLLACVSEMTRASQAADMCYFHMCTKPEDMKPCVVILGTAGDVDEDMLNSGDASPQRMLALLQEKLERAKEEISELQAEVTDLKRRLLSKKLESEERWLNWQAMAMLQEETQMKLHLTTEALNKTPGEKHEVEVAYEKLQTQMVRAARLMSYQGVRALRTSLNAWKKENLFYAFHGFIFILKQEIEERRRDQIEFALRNEVRFLLQEVVNRGLPIERLITEICRMKRQRRELACRILYKHRPYEALEYCLWVWELWQPLRGQLALEKHLEREETRHGYAMQMLQHTSAQIPPMARQLDVLRRHLAEERSAHDITKRDIMTEHSRLVAALCEHLHEHRLQETATLARIFHLTIEEKDERIAILEKEIAEDKHIQSLKSMVVDLESRLRKALDRRKQRPFVANPTSEREAMLKGWKLPHQDLNPGLEMNDIKLNLKMTHSQSARNFVELAREVSHVDGLGSSLTSSPGDKDWRIKEPNATYSAVWR